MDPWSSQQQVVRCVSINNITCHFKFQILNLAFEFDLDHQACTISIEAINGSLCNAQSMGGNPRMLYVPAGYNAQRGSWINLNAVHFR